MISLNTSSFSSSSSVSAEGLVLVGEVEPFVFLYYDREEKKYVAYSAMGKGYTRDILAKDVDYSSASSRSSQSFSSDFSSQTEPSSQSSKSGSSVSSQSESSGSSLSSQSESSISSLSSGTKSQSSASSKSSNSSFSSGSSESSSSVYKPPLTSFVSNFAGQSPNVADNQTGTAIPPRSDALTQAPGVYMGTRGSFDIVSPPNPADSQNPNDKYTDQGGFSRNSANRGTLITDNAGALFSSKAGSVVIRLSLPNPVANGVYQPLAGATDRVLTDMIIWGANFGDVYITQPGFYAAFTPWGIEFTIWTQDGIITIRDTTSNIAANQDALLEFRWDRRGMITGNTVQLSVNGVTTAASSAPIGRYYLNNLYYVDGEGSSSDEPMNANFYVLDNPAGKNGLDCILRRLEVYTQSGIPQSTIPIPPGPPKRWRRAHLEFGFSFEGTEGTGIVVNEPKFQTAIKKTVSLHSAGEIGAQRHILGEDAGQETQPDSIPSVPEDLPIGFEEIRKP